MNSNMIVEWLIETAEGLFGPGTGKEKKAWVVEQVLSLLESIDNLIPVVGAYADIPFVDRLERAAVEEVVQAVFDTTRFAHTPKE